MLFQRIALLALTASAVSACIPFTVGTTAQPVAEGKTTTAIHGNRLVDLFRRLPRR